jgi:general secretion pathway protein I
LSRSTDFKCRRNEGGFTLIEVLVALAVVAVSLTAIGSLVATNARGTRALDQRLALVEATRAIVTGLPDREKIVPGDLSGEYNYHRWQVDTQP